LAIDPSSVEDIPNVLRADAIVNYFFFRTPARPKAEPRGVLRDQRWMPLV